jgi:Calcineurin-like phosphoesterase
MLTMIKRFKWRIAGAAALSLSLFVALMTAQQAQQNIDSMTTVTGITQVMGRPTDHSIVLNFLAPTESEAYVEYGETQGEHPMKTASVRTPAKTPVEITVDNLKPNTHYYYRLRYREVGRSYYSAGRELPFHTQRTPGSTFTFDVQSDSHPERVDRMFNAELYARTMSNVRQDGADFYVTMGDDFSVDEMKVPVTAERVAQVYIEQRQFLGMDGTMAPIFLVNGNHEQAARYLLDGTPNNPAVWAGVSRNRYYPNPAPDGFYTGDKEPVEFVGQLRDYYAWTWGDALFVTLDPYWHSPEVVDNRLGEGPNAGQKKEAQPRSARDMWAITHGEAQYRWLKTTLETSKAKYKFIFAHHVLGTGRGGVEMADMYEWGGKGKSGQWEFDKKRPGWELPIHQMMVKYGVSVFFQGHDHLFVHQEKDGVVYQETPNPANPTYGEYYRSDYKSGDYLTSSGHLRVTVSPNNAKVDYVRSWMPKDVNDKHKQGEVAFSYNIKPRN